MIFRIAAAVLGALMLAGCAAPVRDVPPARLAEPPAELMVPPPEPPMIPACEGEAACRTRYYARARADRADVSSRLSGLQRWVRAGQGKR